MSPLSAGEGVALTMVSSTLSIPSSVTAEPHRTGAMEPSAMPARRPLMVSSREKYSPLKNFSMSSSEVSATDSLIMSHRALASSPKSSGRGLISGTPFL